VAFDDLRADHVHALGYQRNTTPIIDVLAQEGFVFTNAISVAPWTLPSIMSWFTGVYPSQHKILNKLIVLPSGKEETSNLNNLSPQMKTLAEILKDNGYRTGGFTGGAGVGREFGFNQGFNVYTDNKPFAGFSETIPKALTWIKQNKDRRFFVFLHGYDIHGQYYPEGGYDRRFVDFPYKGKLTGGKEEQKNLREEALLRQTLFLTPEDVRFLTSLYDEKIQRADKLFGQFIEKYKKLDLMDKTIFILASDHGEELYEHDRIDHGHSLYDELIHVPLIIILPQIKDQHIIDSQVRSIDIMPTIFDLLGLKISSTIHNQTEGVSLKPLMEGKKLELIILPETDYRYAVKQRAVRTPDGWKTIFNLMTNKKELYNIKSDPGEKNNLMETNPKKGLELETMLKKHMQ
jgi:arylsulfatase A-like enzyme